MQDAIDIKVLQTLGMARACPSPSGERGRFLSCYRSAGALGCHPRIRAGFPRDLSTFAENARSPETPDVCCSDRCMARDRPSPYDEGGRFLSCYRSAGACPPRSLDLCGKRPQPRDPGCLLLRPVHGEGQALALRCKRQSSMARDRPSPYDEGEGFLPPRPR